MISRILALVTVFSVATGCSPTATSDSSLKVTKGDLIGDDVHSPVRALAIDGTTACTGTFISPRRFLTAAHCMWSTQFLLVKTASVQNDKIVLKFSRVVKVEVGDFVSIDDNLPNDLQASTPILAKTFLSISVAATPELEQAVAAQAALSVTIYSPVPRGVMTVAGKNPSAIGIHPDFRLNLFALSPNDLATLDFAEDLAPQTVEVTTEALTDAQSILLVGYGKDDASPFGAVESSGIRRQGHGVFHQAEQTDDGFIVLVGAANSKSTSSNSSTAQGDSGGPLLDETGKTIYGVTSGGSVFSASGDPGQSCMAPTTTNDCLSKSFFVDLKDPTRRSFVLGE